MDKDTALKLALKSLQKADKINGHPNNQKIIVAIEKVLKRPEQEPVAWNVVDPTGKIVATEMNSVRGWARIEGYKPTVEGLLGFHEQGWRVVPTTPPQRTWVGLTDEDTSAAWDAMKTYDDFDTYAKVIEAKLREKNGG